MKAIFLARNSARNFLNHMNTLRLSIGFTGLISLLTPSTYAAGTTLTAGDLAFTMITSDPNGAVPLRECRHEILAQRRAQRNWTAAKKDEARLA
jgi:hypothetical protein